MNALSGREVLNRGPITAVRSWIGSAFVLSATLPVVFIIARHSDRISTEAFEWMILGIAAVWLFLVRVWIFHSRLHRYVANLKVDDTSADFVLDEAVTLAYGGLLMVGFAALGLLLALWRVAGAK
jgi:hypothetical protein